MTEEEIHGKIAEIREKSLKEGLPVMRTETSEILGRIIKEKQPEEVLEIGTCIGVSGIWWSIPIGWFIADFVGILYYRIKIHKHLNIIHE